MTCIAGVEHDEGVVMAADRFHGRPGRTNRHRAPKPFTVLIPGAETDLLVGLSGSTRVKQVIRQGVQPEARYQPHKQDSDLDWLITHVVPALRKAADEAGVLDEDNDGEERQNGRALMAFRGHLYRLDVNFQVVQRMARYDAVGSGGAYAVGALSALQRRLSPRRRAEEAVRAAIAHTPTVVEPIDVVTQEAP